MLDVGCDAGLAMKRTPVLVLMGGREERVLTCTRKSHLSYDLMPVIKTTGKPINELD